MSRRKRASIVRRSAAARRLRGQRAKAARALFMAGWDSKAVARLLHTTRNRVYEVLRTSLALLVCLLLARSVAAQGIVIPNTFVNGTVADANQVNANFAALANDALNRTNGTMTGPLTTHTVIPSVTATYDLASTGVRYRDLFLSGAVNAATAAITGDTTVGGTLIVTSNTTLGGTLGVVSNAAVGGTLNVTNFAYFNAAGLATPARRAQFVGIGATTVGDATSKGSTVLISSSDGDANAGGALEFGFGYSTFTQPYFAAIKALGTNGGNNTVGDLAVYGRRADTDASLTEIARFMNDGGVVIGSATAVGAGGIGWSGATFVRSALTPTQLTANTNNWAPTNFATATVIYFSADAPHDLTGLAGGTPGRVVVLINVGAQTVTVKHGSGSSSAANRFQLPGGADMAVGGDASIRLIYAPGDLWRPF